MHAWAVSEDSASASVGNILPPGEHEPAISFPNPEPRKPRPGSTTTFPIHFLTSMDAEQARCDPRIFPRHQSSSEA